MKRAHFQWKTLACIAACLLALATVGCKGGKDEAVTTAPVTEEVTVADTTAETEATETEAETAAETTEAVTTAEAETTGEPETEPETETEYVPAFDPTAFVPVEVPAVNVAREGFGMASSSRSDAGYSNLNLNDGDLTTKFSTGDAWNTANQFYVFVDLTRSFGVESVKLYPAAGDEAGFPKAFDVLTSMDGETYEPATTVTDAVATADGYAVELGGVEARFVKIVTKELQAPANGRGCYFALGELEVYADVDTSANAILNRHDAWLYVDPDIPMQLEVLYNRDGSAVGSEWKFMTTNPDVAMVDDNGLVTPVSVGTAEIYATNGQNQAVCRVEVKDQAEVKFHVETFYSSGSVNPSQHAKAIDIMKAANVEYLGGVDIYDQGGNVAGPYYIFLCAERGMAYQVRDEYTDGKLSGVYIGVTLEEFISIVKKYEHKAGFYGIYLMDEPTDCYLDYAELVRGIHDYNPHVEGYLNQYPIVSVSGDSDSYYADVASVSGGHGRLYYLSYDNYPYLEDGTFHEWYYRNLDEVRKAGLLYNCATAYYLQAFDRWMLTPEEQMYNAVLGVAYGFKKYQYFICFNGSDRFGLLSPSMQITEMGLNAQAANEFIVKFEGYLGGCDAIEVYHTNETMGQDLLPADFAFTHVGGGEAIYSLFEALDGSGKQYILITNKNFAADGAVTFTVKATDGLRDLKILNTETEKMETLAVGADGTFTLDIGAGMCALIELPEGYDASRPDPETDNLALNKPAYVSSNGSDFWNNTNFSGMYLTDGDLSEMGWNPAANDETPWVRVDLGEVYEISKVTIRMTKSVWSRRCRNFVISVSEDGVNYTEVARVENFEWDKKTMSADFTFDTTSARYIKIEQTVNDSSRAFGEIEVYS